MADLQLKYDATLPYQKAAVQATADLFAGQPIAESNLAVTFEASGGSYLTEHGVGNRLVLDDQALLRNLQSVQARHGIEPATWLANRDFAVEMETGTGKTYVYLRTAFELNKLYGFTKFVIVVPSIAIREGVVHSIRTMREHFQALYGVPFDAMVYDSKQVSRLRAYATANTLQLLVMNIQAFQRDVKPEGSRGAPNVIYVEQDRLSGHAPIEFLRGAHPIVVVDEPQKMTGEASAAAIERLNPLCTLRYSATYESAQKIYRLGPIEAFDQGLVKGIEVLSLREGTDFNDAYVRLIKTDAKKQNAQVEINSGTGSAAKRKKLTVKKGDDLFVKAGERQEYRDGFIVRGITFAEGNEHIDFTNGLRVNLGAASGGLDDEMMRQQVIQTVREHLDKEARLRPLGIKVLSLFFIDKVANYRVYQDDGKAWTLGKIGVWFEEAFTKLINEPEYRGLITDPVESIHGGYFSQDRKGSYRDTSGETREDEQVYHEIMKAKEQLLSFDSPLRFIFSHSALREGWDNPNVFQICTLNETRSDTRKRQEIGRGLRLPVNQQGERIRDQHINRLTVVANESYDAFAKGLQKEYEEDYGIEFGRIKKAAFANLELTLPDGTSQELGYSRSQEIWSHLQARGYLDADGRPTPSFAPHDGFVLDVPTAYEAQRAEIVDVINRFVLSSRIKKARDRTGITVRKQVLLDDEFGTFWEQVSRRTRYRVFFETDALIERAAERIRQAPGISRITIEIEKRDITVTQGGIHAAEAPTSSYDEYIERDYVIPDVLAYLQNETELTRHTLAQILIRSGRAEDLRRNPQAFITMATREITAALQHEMLNGIVYEPDGSYWSIELLEKEAEAEIQRYLDKLYQVQNERKTPYNYVEFQSEVERVFAQKLDTNPDVRFFVKLPSWFKVDTPLGFYNPDWAIAVKQTGGADRLYLICETKGSTNPDELRGNEKNKIACGRKHFEALDVRYEVATTLSEALASVSG